MRPARPVDRAPDRITEQLEAIRASGRYRTLEVPAGFHFCSNDYLGLGGHADLARAVSDAVAAEGAASTGSRLLSGHRTAWEDLERDFAARIGADAALFFNSGYAANLGLLGAVLHEEDTVFSDAANHASIVDGLRLARCRKAVFRHLDLDDLEQALAGTEEKDGERFIVIETLFSMDGDRTPVGDILNLAERYGARVILDEAHAVGVWGPAGRGLAAWAPRREALFAAVYPCGKALASPGAFVAGSAALKDLLINRARTFIYTTALPPYVAAQVQAALQLAARADDRRLRVYDLTARLRQGLIEAGFDTGTGDSQIVPVILGRTADAVAAADALRAAGYPVRAIRPPTVAEGMARLRLSVTADLPPEAIDGLIQVLTRYRSI